MNELERLALAIKYNDVYGIHGKKLEKMIKRYEELVALMSR